MERFEKDLRLGDMNLTIPFEIRTLGVINAGMQCLSEVLTRISNVLKLPYISVTPRLTTFSPFFFCFLSRSAPTSVSLNLPLTLRFVFQSWIQPNEGHINT